MKESGTKHFSSQDWADFVNGTASTTQQATMQKHLNEGCKNCGKAAAFWAGVREIARREASFEAPVSAVRHVQDAFRIATEDTKARRKFQIPRLVFDSLWQPALAGVRSTTTAPRQVLYRTGELSVEMRLEPEPLSERMSIVGQIYRSAEGNQGLTQVPVLVTSKTGSLAETHTNEFGEFQMSFVPNANLRIVFGIPDAQDLSIPLDTRGVAIFGRT